MSITRRPSQSTKCGPRLEPAGQLGHNGQRTNKSDKPDQRIVALVKLLARLAAEKDFCDEPHER